MTKTLCTIVLALSLAAACASESTPGPDASTVYEDCLLLCSEVDTDLSSLPANMCPGHDPSEDTAYQRCVGECVSRMPAGNWCPPF
jgi:hypothetical protein